MSRLGTLGTSVRRVGAHARWSAAAALALQLLGPTPAHAFCGFFVSGADAALTNNASQVALLRNASLFYNDSARSDDRDPL